MRKAEGMSVKNLLLVLDLPGSVYCILVEERLRERRMRLDQLCRPRGVNPRKIVYETFRE